MLADGSLLRALKGVVKMSNLTRGGQGRTDKDVEEDGRALFCACMITGLFFAAILAFTIVTAMWYGV